MNNNSIEVINLSKTFGYFIAVDNINFSVKKGEIFGFLGANGAGKSTTIRMLCALLEPTSGTAIVGGYDIVKQPELVKKNIGYMSQKFSLYDDLTVQENINFFGSIYGLYGKEMDDRKSWVLEIANLKDLKNRITGTLPGGLRQRLALGCATIHKPKILFLDEPTGGVDPISRRMFWDLINNLSEDGITIFVTTHFLDEAEYCNSIYLIHEGKIVAGGSPNYLKKEHIKGFIFEIECDNIINAMEILSSYNFISSISIFGSYLHIQILDKNVLRIIENILKQNNITISRIDIITPSLEDVFISLIEKKRN